MKKNIKVVILLLIGVILIQTKQVQASSYIDAYIYNSSSCITGEETTCQKTECYKNNTAGSCPNGTIVKYQVNDTTSKYFHVIHDDGNTMTMQQRENTIYNTAWYASADDNTKGPLTVLQTLENVTSSWSNVNNQTYTMGTTNFNGTNAYTGCSYTKDSSDVATCTTNTYTLGSRTARARMITMQEAASLGCTDYTKSCPTWMNNYLYESTSYGGTVNDDHTENGGDHNYGYWTMSAHSANSNYPWHVRRNGFMHSGNRTTCLLYGARAVVVVNKESNSINQKEPENKNSNQVVEVKDTLKTTYIGLCIGFIILLLGVIVIMQTFRKQKK